ncbi:MAG: pyrroline-5-carboxylate reductase [Cyanobacteria bacterium P01_C01_bin.89]
MATKLGIVGGGVMGEALLSRIVSGGLYGSGEILVSDLSPLRRDTLREQYGIAVTESNADVASSASVVLLAIKPQIFSKVAPSLKVLFQGLETPPLVLSILAGTSLGTLSAGLGEQVPIVRAMPNTPATVGAGITAIARGDQVSDGQFSTARAIFAAVGSVVEVPETLMDAVTGVSGSGPAYVALMVEALADGGVSAGLPRSIASELALQTVLGAAQLMSETDLHPAILKDRVSSPGGTTIAGVAALEKNGFRSAVIQAVQAASQRSQALGKQ